MEKNVKVFEEVDAKVVEIWKANKKNIWAIVEVYDPIIKIICDEFYEKVNDCAIEIDDMYQEARLCVQSIFLDRKTVKRNHYKDVVKKLRTYISNIFLCTDEQCEDPTISIYDRNEDDEEFIIDSMINSYQNPLDVIVEYSHLKVGIRTLLDTLPARERQVILLLVGLEDGHPRTLEDVGKEFNVGRERIRQLQAKALRKLRNPSRSRYLVDFLDSEFEYVSTKPTIPSEEERVEFERREKMAYDRAAYQEEYREKKIEAQRASLKKVKEEEEKRRKEISDEKERVQNEYMQKVRNFCIKNGINYDFFLRKNELISDTVGVNNKTIISVVGRYDTVIENMKTYPDKREFELPLYIHPHSPFADIDQVLDPYSFSRSKYNLLQQLKSYNLKVLSDLGLSYRFISHGRENVSVTIPIGWYITGKYSDQICDETGSVRIRVSNMKFFDMSETTFITYVPRYEIYMHKETYSFYYYVYDNRDGDVIYKAPSVNCYAKETPEASRRMTELMAHKYMKDNYPDYMNPVAYWKDPISITDANQH